MNNSFYLQEKIKSDKELALLLERTSKAISTSSLETGNYINAGIERASWYSSCFFDSYKDVCDELKFQDYRMILSIKELFKRKDVIYDIFILYIDYMENDIENKNKSGTVRAAVSNISNVLATARTAMLTRNAIAYSLAESLAQSGVITSSISAKIISKSQVLIAALQYYGVVHKAAQAANSLKLLDPAVYKILYYNRVEMLYLFIEPILSRIIRETKVKANLNHDEFIKILSEAANV